MRWMAAGLCVAGTMFAQSGFEVASVKSANPNQRDSGHQINCSSGAEFVAWDQSLQTLISWAYDFPANDGRIAGGPNWINSEKTTFYVEGKPAHKVNLAECRTMLQSLLADRFALLVHRENRELPVYVMSAGRKGPRLHRTDEDPGVPSSVTLNGDEIQLNNGYSQTAKGRGMSMQELARFLSRMPMIGRPVIDKTGLDGYYGFSLDYAATLGDTSRPDIFAALQEQLGLKLEPAKQPVEILVVDRAEMPTAN